MKLVCKKLLLALLMLTCAVANSYELATHGHLTYEGYKKSVLFDDNFLQQLGLVKGKNPFGLYYYDVSGSTIKQRKQNPFEEDENRMPNGTEPLSIEGWLMRGAIREDDVCVKPFPHCDGPTLGEVRIKNHFYDPVYNRTLSIPLWPDGELAPNWAIGTDDFLDNPDIPVEPRDNHYTIKDAREAMFRALTGMSGSGETNIRPNNTPVTEDVRKAYWATTFRALGDVLHIVEDMAQPQHTRNDWHLINGDSDKKVYEKYTDKRAKQDQGDQFRCFNGGKRLPPPLIYGNYPKPQFDNYSDYFSTVSDATTPRNILPGKGMADYSNRGFFSAGSNFKQDGTNEYAYPQSFGLTSVAVNEVDPCIPTTGAAEIKDLLFASVLDTVAPTYPDQVTDSNLYPVTAPAGQVPLSARGLLYVEDNLDPDVEPLKQIAYTLAEQNYIAMADLLIPRAVAYSAGLIDYFFRGRFEITPPDEGIYGIVDHAVEHTVVSGVPYIGNGGNTARDNVYGFNKIKLKLRNTTADINDGQNIDQQTMMNGTLLAIAKYRRNTCYQPDLSGEPVDNIGNTVGGCRLDGFFSQEQEVAISIPKTVINGVVDGFDINSGVPADLAFDFNATPIPINAWDLVIQIVYRGSLGSETDAVVVATKNIFEPTFFSYVNTSDYVNVDGIYYTPAEIQASPGLTAVVDSYGNNNGILDEPIDSYTLGFINFSFNNSTTNIVNLLSLPVQKYFRVAVLTDTYQITLNNSGNISSNWLASTNEFNSQGQLNTTPINHAGTPPQYLTDFRGTNWRNLIVEDHNYSLVLVTDFIALK